MASKYDYLIVGCGLYGAVFANMAKQRGKKVLIIDKRNHIGGNIYTENINGINVHKYGAHIFHTNDEKIWNYVNKFAKFNRFINQPLAKFKDELYNLPFNMNTFSKMWNISSPTDAMKIIKEQIDNSQIKNPKNLEEFAIATVGNDIYEKLIKGYTEKQWGRKANELPSFIIKRLPLRFVYDNNYFNDTFQGIPIGGYTNLIEKMIKGIKVLLKTDYFDFIQKNKDIAKKTIYCGKIDEFFNYKLGVLEYRSLRFVEETLNTENFQGNAVINYTDIETPFTRIIEHKHFENNEQKFTIITKEYPYEWNKSNEAFYPINDEKNNLLYKKYLKLAKKQSNIMFCGRLAEYKYYDMDKVVKNALKLAKKELKQ